MCLISQGYPVFNAEFIDFVGIKFLVLQVCRAFKLMVYLIFQRLCLYCRRPMWIYNNLDWIINAQSRSCLRGFYRKDAIYCRAFKPRSFQRGLTGSKMEVRNDSAD